MCEYTASTRAKCADTRKYTANTQDTCISRVFEIVLSVSRVYQLKYLDTCIISVFELYLAALETNTCVRKDGHEIHVFKSM